MPIINIGSKNYSYPDEGEKRWGGKLKKVILGLISYVSSSLENIVLLDGDQTISGQKIFENAPKVSVGIDKNKRDVRLIHEEEFNTIAKNNNGEIEKRVSFLEETFNSFKQNQLVKIQNILDEFDKETIKNNISNELDEFNEGTLNKGSASNLFFSKSIGLSSGKESITVSKSLSALAKICDSLVPIGTILPFHLLTSSQKARWTIFNEEFHEYDQRVDLNGYFKILEGGPWALCDGNFLLPPNYFGRDDKNKCLSIPDLSDTFLSGDKNDGNLGKMTGQNDKLIALTEMPYHAHGIDHTHEIFIYWTGVEFATVRHGIEYATVMNYISSRTSKERAGLNKSPWNYGRSDLRFDKVSSELMSMEAISTGVIGYDTIQRTFNNRPKSLKVRFFMRVH